MRNFTGLSGLEIIIARRWTGKKNKMKAGFWFIFNLGLFDELKSFGWAGKWSQWQLYFHHKTNKQANLSQYL